MQIQSLNPSLPIRNDEIPNEIPNEIPKEASHGCQSIEIEERIVKKLETYGTGLE
jgi:hypothetical protein